MRRVSVGVVLLPLVLLVDGGLATAAQRTVEAAEVSSDDSALPPFLHSTMHARAYVSPAAPFVPNEQPVGSPAPRSDVTATVSSGRDLQFGLATFPSSPQTYPAISTDGGSTWKIDGPLFHVDAAQGAAVVESTGALRPAGAYFWGRGGNVIWMTYASDAHWSLIAFGAGVDQLNSTRGTLEAVVFGNQVDHATATQRFLYTSTDSGKTWKLRRRLANLRSS